MYIYRQSPALNTLVKLYVDRTYHVWKECDILPWLEKNVHRVLERVDTKETFIKDCEVKRAVRYQGIPRNILRHLILCDLKDVPLPVGEVILEVLCSLICNSNF